MKLQDLLKDLELGKVYTDKDRKPFKVNEEISDELVEEILNELGGFSNDSFTDVSSTYTAPKRDEKGGTKAFLQKFSSSEAKAIVDGGLKNYVKDLRKVQGRVVKDWMKASKSNQIDFFDIIRGLKTGDARRAHPYETDFLVSLLTKDKIIDRFRSYFKGKKGKKGRTK